MPGSGAATGRLLNAPNLDGPYQFVRRCSQAPQEASHGAIALRRQAMLSSTEVSTDFPMSQRSNNTNGG